MKRQLSLAARLPVGQAREQHRQAIAKERACQESVDQLAEAVAEARAGLKLAATERRHAEDDLEDAEEIREEGKDPHVKGDAKEFGDPLLGGRA